jgi:hypothetical protein
VDTLVLHPERSGLDQMKAASKGTLLLAVVAMACAAVTASAQAQTWNPDNTPFVLIADDPVFAGVMCDTGTMEGTTGRDSGVVTVDIEFQEPCSLQGVDLEATTDCNDGEFTVLKALDANTNDGEVDEFLTGFQCTVVVTGVCTLTVGPQNLSSNNDADLINEGTEDAALDVDVDMEVFNNNSLCGPVPSGIGTWAGLYEGSPITIDP